MLGEMIDVSTSTLVTCPRSCGLILLGRRIATMVIVFVG